MKQYVIIDGSDVPIPVEPRLTSLNERDNSEQAPAISISGHISEFFFIVKFDKILLRLETQD